MTFFNQNEIFLIQLLFFETKYHFWVKRTVFWSKWHFRIQAAFFPRTMSIFESKIHFLDLNFIAMSEFRLAVTFLNTRLS